VLVCWRVSIHLHPVIAEGITELLVSHVVVVHVHVVVEISRRHRAVVVDWVVLCIVCDSVVEGVHLSVELNLSVRESLGWSVDGCVLGHGRGAVGGR
jgi:hypothetical protein